MINVTISDVIIPYNQIVAASILYATLYSIFFICCWWITSDKLSITITGLVSIIVILYIIISFSYPFIYVVLPRFNVVFHDPSYEFNNVEFNTRIFNFILFIVFFSCAIVAIIRCINAKSQHRKDKMQMGDFIDQIEIIQQRVSTQHLSPHFIKNVISAVMGDLTIKNHLLHIDQLTKLSYLMHYAIDMQEDAKVVSWSQEWEQVENLLELAKLCSGEKSVISKLDFPQQDVKIPIGLLLMPIENALKYGSISKKTPLYLNVKSKNKQWFFKVENHFTNQKRDVIASTKSGYQLMQKCLDLGNWPIELRIVEEGNRFTASIVGKYPT